MIRCDSNPILSPITEHPWESTSVFNPAAVRLGDQIHIIYRAMGEDKVSRLGYARSFDGYRVDERLSTPIFEPLGSYEKFGCEDPRLTVLGDRIVMTYTAYSDIFQIGLTTISVENFLKKRWKWSERIYPFSGISDKNAIIFPSNFEGRYVMYHRLDPDIYVAYSDDLHAWVNGNIVMRPRVGHWDGLKVGAASPPIRVEDGWLLLYHGVDEYRTYRLGFALVDPGDPEKIIYRSEKPILEPTEDYECRGIVPNVIFSCGAVLLDSRVLIYYGGADMVIGVATFELDEIMPRTIKKSK